MSGSFQTPQWEQPPTETEHHGNHKELPAALHSQVRERGIRVGTALLRVRSRLPVATTKFLYPRNCDRNSWRIEISQRAACPCASRHANVTGCRRMPHPVRAEHRSLRSLRLAISRVRPMLRGSRCAVSQTLAAFPSSQAEWLPGEVRDDS